MNLVLEPEAYGVVVASNLSSDILTNLTAAVMGGIGLALSANVNPGNDAPGVYEPVHGSAPDIAGQGIADPITAIRSGELMLSDLGEKDAAVALRAAVATYLADEKAPRTPDLGGSAGTGTSLPPSVSG